MNKFNKTFLYILCCLCFAMINRFYIPTTGHYLFGILAGSILTLAAQEFFDL